MKLSAPIHVLKNQAKKLKQEQSITMVEALDQIAKREGYTSWGLLQSKFKDHLPRTSLDVLNYFKPGDIVLVGGRPGHGKTTYSTQLLFEAVGLGRQCFFFSLDLNPIDFQTRFPEVRGPLLFQDYSDEISAEYIIKKTENVIGENSFIVIDYLQLLDQKRTKPELQNQVAALKKYAKDKKCTIVFISQVDRSFEGMDKVHPDLEDVRLPNPLELSSFNKVIFLHNRMMYFVRPSKFQIPSVY